MTDATPRRTALITGASSGIGLALADVFARHGFDLVLTARRDDRLRAAAADLSTKYGCRVHTIVADLADPTSPGRIVGDIEQAGLTIDALVNNAGYGQPGRFLDTPWDGHRAFLQVLVSAVVELTHRLMPGMVRRGYGRVINVASLAGLVPSSAGHTLYGASKSLLIKFSESLHLEGRRSNVHVTALCPGFTYSEFHDVNGTRPLVSQLPRWMFMDAMPVAEQAYDAVMRGQAVYVSGRINRAIALGARYVPQWLVQIALRRTASKFRKA
jgi:uncharacterized protein